MSGTHDLPEIVISRNSDNQCGIGQDGPAHEAFHEGIEIFKRSLTRDPEKIDRVEQLRHCKLEDLLGSVVAAQSQYQSKKNGSKAHECIVAFSRRICYYGSIMDVIVQQSPEYVSLAWGAMKLLFGAIIEHERTGTTILTALCDIADSLPKAELTITLYPTNEAKHAVAMLYAHIIRFLIRALEYYEGSRTSRVIQSVTRPVSLRYDDLIKLIQRDSQNIASHAAMRSQSELRAVHDGVRGIQSQIENFVTSSRAAQINLRRDVNSLTEIVYQLQQSLLRGEAGFASIHNELRSTLSDIQMTQALTIISSECTVNHKTAFQATMRLHSRLRLCKGLSNLDAFSWLPPQLRAWDQSRLSSNVLVKSMFRQKQQIVKFSADLIGQLLKANVSVLWVLGESGKSYPVVDVLKSLILQALSLEPGSFTNSESRVAFQIKQFLGSNFEDEYLNMLCSILQSFKLVYIIFNAKSMSQKAGLKCRSYLQELRQFLSKRSHQTILKTIVVDYGPDLSPDGTPEDFVVRVGRMSTRRVKKRLRRRAVMFANQPLAITAD